MNDAAVKQTRAALRKVQEHLLQAQFGLGAQHEAVGMVDVIHHPENALSHFNYVTPRRNTAWVSGSYVKQGLSRLRELDRELRVCYIEALFPPIFARTLRDLGLEVVRETPLMIYYAGGFDGAAPAAPEIDLPASAKLEMVRDQRGVKQWRQVWDRVFADDLTHGLEPISADGALGAIKRGSQCDIVLTLDQTPVGVVRLTLQEATRSGHVVACVLTDEARTTDNMRLLVSAALRSALERGCEVVFAPGDNEASRAACRSLGFVDVSSVICYSAPDETTDEISDDERLVQPVLALRG